MPRINVEALSTEAETEEAAHLNRLVNLLNYYINEMENALSLYQHAEELFHASFKQNGVSGPKLPLYAGWMSIAGRDAAMTIFHFGKILSAIHKRVGLCPTLHSIFDAAQMKAALKAFAHHFPKAERIRHAIGHAAEMMKNPKRFERNRGYGRYEKGGNIHISSGAFILCSVSDGRLVMTREGELLNLEISPDIADHLKAIRDHVLAAFAPIVTAPAKRPEPS